jgi:uncharacterized membrane protein YhaH (DUF805 family)
MDWMLMPLRRYAEFSGRSRRKEYWMFALFAFLVGIVLSIVERIVGLDAVVGPYGFLLLLFWLAFLVPSIAVGIRRLHDTNRSGWWLLIALVPLIGAIVLLVVYVTEGTTGPNDFGPDPKGADHQEAFV